MMKDATPSPISHSATFGKVAESTPAKTCQLSLLGTTWQRNLKEHVAKWRSGEVTKWQSSQVASESILSFVHYPLLLDCLADSERLSR